MDIGGHPPFPIVSKQFSGNLLFLAIFTSGAILRAYMKVFQDCPNSIISKGMIEASK